MYAEPESNTSHWQVPTPGENHITVSMFACHKSIKWTNLTPWYLQAQKNPKHACSPKTLEWVTWKCSLRQLTNKIHHNTTTDRVEHSWKFNFQITLNNTQTTLHHDWKVYQSTDPEFAGGWGPQFLLLEHAQAHQRITESGNPTFGVDSPLSTAVWTWFEGHKSIQ